MGWAFGSSFLLDKGSGVHRPIGRQGRVGRGYRGSRGAGCDVGSRVLVAWWRRDVGRMRMGHVVRMDLTMQYVPA